MTGGWCQIPDTCVSESWQHKRPHTTFPLWELEAKITVRATIQGAEYGLELNGSLSLQRTILTRCSVAESAARPLRSGG